VNAAIEGRGLVVVRGGRRVLDGVDLDVHPGEVVALIGPNGAGKSTLIETLAGLIRSTDGTIRKRGRVAAALQSPSLANRSVLANIELALSWWGVPAPERRERAMEALRLLSVEHLAGRAAVLLSGGQARRVHLARVLALRSDVLLLDEPFAGLDPVTRGELIYDAATALRSGLGGTLVVLHDRNEAWALADRVILLLDGRLEAEGTPKAVFEHPPSPAAARFVGFIGEIDSGDRTRFLRASDVRIRPQDQGEGKVVTRFPMEDGIRVSVDVPGGRVVGIVDPPGPEPGSRVDVDCTGGVWFKQERPLSGSGDDARNS